MQSPTLRARTATPILLALMACLSLPAMGRDAPAGIGGAAGSGDILDTPAQISPKAQHSLLLAVASAGKRVIAVGLRGHILHSSDGGAHWTQANVPVSADLTAVTLVGEHKAWAVGHDGVILHSRDGGANWEKQLDGRQAMPQILADLQQTAAGEPAAARDRLIDEARRFAEEGPNKPFLAVWFANEDVGFAVGAYNLIFHTRDGGKTWSSWFDRTDNPQFLHLNAIHGDGADVVIAGEAGLVLKLDTDGQRFVAIDTPYKGSFFDIKTWDGQIFTVGMRSNAWRYADGAWLQAEIPVQAGLAGVTRMADGRIVIASQNGMLLVSSDGGRRFSVVPETRSMALSGLTKSGADELALSGSQGVVVTRLKP